MSDDDVICISSSEDEAYKKPPKKKNDKPVYPLFTKKRKCSSSDDSDFPKKIKKDFNSSPANDKKCKSTFSPKPGTSKHFDKIESGWIEKSTSKTSNSKQQTKRIKPQLIVKTVVHLDPDPPIPPKDDIFQKFVDFCLDISNETDTRKITDKLQIRYNQIDAGNKEDNEFQSFLDSTTEKIINNPKRLFSELLLVRSELKRRSKITQSKSKTNELVNFNQSLKKPNESSKINASTNEHSSSEDRITKENKKMIKKLVETIEKCKSRIKELEFSEVDWDDDDNSTYLKEDRYKRKLIVLYKELSKLENDVSFKQELCKKKYLKLTDIKGEMTGIVSVDSKIIDYINNRIKKVDRLKHLQSNAIADHFRLPDFEEIYTIVTDCNTEKELKLTPRRISDLATKAFKAIGNHLQQMRGSETKEFFDSLTVDHKEADATDPATKDAELRKILIKNKHEGDKNMQDIFAKYVDKEKEYKEKESLSESESDSEETDEEKICKDTEVKECISIEKPSERKTSNECEEVSRNKKRTSETIKNTEENGEEHEKSREDVKDSEKNLNKDVESNMHESFEPFSHNEHNEDNHQDSGNEVLEKTSENDEDDDNDKIKEHAESDKDKMVNKFVENQQKEKEHVESDKDTIVIEFVENQQKEKEHAESDKDTRVNDSVENQPKEKVHEVTKDESFKKISNEIKSNERNDWSDDEVVEVSEDECDNDEEEIKLTNSSNAESIKPMNPTQKSIEIISDKCNNEESSEVLLRLSTEECNSSENSEITNNSEIKNKQSEVELPSQNESHKSNLSVPISSSVKEDSVIIIGTYESQNSDNQEIKDSEPLKVEIVSSVLSPSKTADCQGISPSAKVQVPVELTTELSEASKSKKNSKQDEIRSTSCNSPECPRNSNDITETPQSPENPNDNPDLVTKDSVVIEPAKLKPFIKVCDFGKEENFGALPSKSNNLSVELVENSYAEMAVKTPNKHISISSNSPSPVVVSVNNVYNNFSGRNKFQTPKGFRSPRPAHQSNSSVTMSERNNRFTTSTPTNNRSSGFTNQNNIRNITLYPRKINANTNSQYARRTNCNDNRGNQNNHPMRYHPQPLRFIHNNKHKNSPNGHQIRPFASENRNFE